MNKVYLILAVLLMALVSCKDTTYFTIEGEVSGQQSMNLYMRYYGNEHVNTGVTAVTEGKFKFKGASATPTIVEIMDNERKVLGRLYIQNGQKVTVSLDRNNPWAFQASGGNYNEEWSAEIRRNAGPLGSGGPEANKTIEEYIAHHPDNLVSSLLFTTLYDYSIDPIRADSVAESISVEARPGFLFDGYATQMNAVNKHAMAYKVDTIKYRPYKKDTVAYFTPKKAASLLGFTSDKSNRADSVVPRYKELSKKSKLELLDIMLVQDTAMWKRITKRDSADWVQGWVPGGIYAQTIDSLSIPSLPYYLVVDTAGVQHYRGKLLRDASDAIDALIK